jgi:hypothetical protein
MSTQILNDFISQDDALTISELLESHLDETPRAGIKATLGWGTPAEAAKAALDERVRFDDLEGTITKTFLKVLSEVAEHYKVVDDKVCIVNAFYYEMSAGSHQGLHCDTCELDGSPLDDKLYSPEDEPNIWSAILYLNNSGDDFKGGEVAFPKEEILHAPKVGDLVYFKADVDHPHEVKTVSSGTRKCLVFFMGRYSNAVKDETNFSDR